MVETSKGGGLFSGLFLRQQQRCGMALEEREEELNALAVGGECLVVLVGDRKDQFETTGINGFRAVGKSRIETCHIATAKHGMRLSQGQPAEKLGQSGKLGIGDLPGHFQQDNRAVYSVTYALNS
jgi:hypothetical protein